jgi:hypothetical protein
MSDDDDIDPIQAVQITRRIGQTFDFVRDVIDAPGTLEDIPNGSVLIFRDVIIDQTPIHLTAYATDPVSGHWSARVTGPASVLSAGQYSEETGETAAAALDKLETRLREDARVTWSRPRAVGE